MIDFEVGVQIHNAENTANDRGQGDVNFEKRSGPFLFLYFLCGMVQLLYPCGFRTAFPPYCKCS